MAVKTRPTRFSRLLRVARDDFKIATSLNDLTLSFSLRIYIYICLCPLKYHPLRFRALYVSFPLTLFQPCVKRNVTRRRNFSFSFSFFLSKLAGKEDYQWRDKIDSRRFDNRLLAIALNARWYIVGRPKSWLTLLSIFTPFSFLVEKLILKK